MFTIPRGTVISICMAEHGQHPVRVNSQGAHGFWRILFLIHTSFYLQYESHIRKILLLNLWEEFSCTWSIEPSFSNSNGHWLGPGKRPWLTGPGCVSSPLPVVQCEASCLKLRACAESGGRVVVTAREDVLDVKPQTDAVLPTPAPPTWSRHQLLGEAAAAPAEPPLELRPWVVPTVASAHPTEQG